MNKTYTSSQGLLIQHYKNILLILFFLAATACSHFDKKQTIISDNNQNSVATKNLTHQCLLPSRIRKLSRNFMYLAPGSIIQTSQSICTKRGGKIISKI